MTMVLACARVGRATPANSRGSLSRGVGERDRASPPPTHGPRILPHISPLAVFHLSRRKRQGRQWGLCPHKDHLFFPASTLPSFQDPKQI